MALVLDHVHATWLLVETRIEDGLEVNGQELVRVSLLAHSVAAPNSGKGADDWTGVGAFSFGELLYEVCVTALVTCFGLALALIGVVLGETEGVKG